MNKKIYASAFALAIICLMSSCIPQRKYTDLKSSYDDLVVEATSLREVAAEHTKEVEGMRIEITQRQEKITTLEKQLSELNSNLKKIEEGAVGNEEELRKQLEVSIKDREALSFELENKRKELYRREKELEEKSRQLEEKIIIIDQRQLDNETRSSELDKLKGEIEEKERKLAEQQKIMTGQSGDIEKLTSDVADRERRVQELEGIISSQQSQVQALESKISSALVDFAAGDLSVNRRDGKVYVSLQSKLLFKSGSKTVEPRGKEALGKVADVLRNNSDIDIIIEGHTDNVGGTQANWDLSVLRATSVVKLLIDTYGVNPGRIVASGKGEHAPVASNDNNDGKQLNRRIEIILSPKLDELYNVIGR